VLLAVAALSACAGFTPTSGSKPLPNQVVIGARLVTAGQPARPQLMQLRQRGFDVVVHLAVDGAADSVSDEPQIVQAQALEYVRVPIDAHGPTADDAHAVAQALERFARRRVLVHCEQNILASSLVFLYRVRAHRDEAQQALADLERVWVPHGKLRDFIERQLRERGIDFDAI
jgi:protein tyrosine phosphatase (PTP) superfamily phosphohydrolase (DUF442 family)